MSVAPSQSLITRYAPSPTGYLHLGHVAHLIYVWGLAQRLGARVLLRMEDHDRQRCRPEFETAIVEDLEWLGFEPRNTVGQAPSDYRQSDCDAVYRQAIDRLRECCHVYGCVCSRKDLAAECPLSDAGERVYQGRCRQAGHVGTRPHALRLEWSADAPETFDDGLLGAQSQEPREQCGDLLLRDRRCNWSYQLAVAVDDLRHGVNLVIRGEDLLASTGRQIRLARLLGRPKPASFYHHPLVNDSRGSKLSKKQQSPPVGELRAAGVSSAEVIGRAAAGVGLIKDFRPIDREDVAGLMC